MTHLTTASGRIMCVLACPCGLIPSELSLYFAVKHLGKEARVWR